MKKMMVVSFIIFSLAGMGTIEASEFFGKISYKGSPLKNADISIQGKQTKTNDLGFYSIDLDPGSYTFEAKLPDGKSKQEKIVVFPQDTEKNLKWE